MAAFGISMIQALDSLKTASETLKYLRDVDAKFDKAELKIKVAELAESLSLARSAVLDAKEENETLRAQIKELQNAQNDRANMVHKDNLYFFRQGEKQVGPYCPRCFEHEHQRMPVTKLEPAFRELGQYKCPQCKAVY